MVALSLRKDFEFRGVSTMLELRFLLTLPDKLSALFFVRIYEPLRTKSGTLQFKS